MKARSTMLGLALLAVLSISSLNIAIAASDNADKKPTSWTAYKNPKLGFTVYYPSNWFTPDPEPADKSGRSFTSADGKARIAAFGMVDRKWLGAELYDKKRITADGRVDDELALGLYAGELREEGDAYSNVKEKKVTRNWLTLEGERDGTVYFEKFIFSCKDKVISALSFTYPKDQAAKYAPMLKTMLRRFGAGSGANTPRCA